MDISLPAVIGIAIGTMFFGYFFGLLEGRGQGYKKRRKEEAADRSSLSPAAPQGPAAAPADKGLLMLSRDPQGRPSLYLDGKPIRSAPAAPEDRKRLIDLMVLLRPWVEPAVDAGRRGASPPGSGPRVPAPTTRFGVPAEGVQVLAANSPTGTSASPAPLSLVLQIDSILQRRIAGTPLAGRGIRLAEALHGGAIVFAGTAQYDGVDQVPDLEIRAAIRAAIAEWEQTYAGG